MRNTKRHIILLLFSILLLSSCDKNQQYPPLLVQADSAYMRGDYQLADSLLGSYNVSSEGQSQDALMYYQLLGLCKKFVRAAITSKELSRADSVEHFYSQSQHEPEHGKALLFLGNAYQDGRDYPNAMKCYLQTKQLAINTSDSILLEWAEKALGNVYLDQRMLKECIPHYITCYKIAQSMNDTLRMAHAAYRMGIVSTAKNDADSAIYYYKQTIELGRNSQQAKSILPAAQYQLCDIYIQIEEYDSAMIYMTRDTLNDVNWAYWNYGKQNLDSASFYFSHALNHETLRGRAEILYMLGTIEQQKGNRAKALNLRDLYIATADSLQHLSQTEETRRVQAQYNHNLIKKELEESLHKSEKMQDAVILSILILLLLISALLIVFFGYKHKKEEEIEREKLLRKEEQHRYMLSVDRIKENNSHIAMLEQQLSEAKANNDTESSEYLAIHTELLLSENHAILMNQQRHDYLYKQLQTSDIYKKIHRFSDKTNIHLNDAEWEQLETIVDKTYDHFTQRLLQICPLSETELKVCQLVKLEVSPLGMANLLFKSIAAIGMIRKRMYKKITKSEGSAQMFDEFIKKF